jgi:Putative peptidoglycan binding domain
MAILCAAAASLIVIVNAVFLQSGPHPAPFLSNPTTPTSGGETPPNLAPVSRSDDGGAARPAAGVHGAGTVASRRNDPIGDLIGSTLEPPARIAAVQRALSEFGYGPLRLSGVLDQQTSAAIEKFEVEHELPATGRLSSRVLRELAVMTGRPID